ncbi:MAG: homocysteine S-methyltransferase family protein [Candidatus Marinimicrobia bacterium]|nr:homocysteine S-methyltransferase family protein [Candidatus Neomarinimicrobiota bacterium]
MKNILERINDGEILLGDGAIGTQIQKYYSGDMSVPELLNIDAPKIIERIALEYFQAGADLIETNTFGGSVVKLGDSQNSDRVEELNSKAVDIVKKVTNGKSYISGSVGPSGKMLEPMGVGNPEEIKAGFKKQVEILIDSGVDVICIETMIDLEEAVLAVEATREVSDSIPIITTMTFNKTPRGFFTIMGNNIEYVSEILEEVGADIIGSNCGNGFEKMVEIAKEFKKYSKLPIMIQSNAGQPVSKNGEIFYLETPEFFAEKTKELIEIGVSIIGGCCGTTPEHIGAMREVIGEK